MPLDVVNAADGRIGQLIKGCRGEVEIEFGTSGATVPDRNGDRRASDYTGKSSSERQKKSKVGV